MDFPRPSLPPHAPSGRDARAPTASPNWLRTCRAFPAGFRLLDMNTKSHPVTLSEPACALVEAVVASGRYRDFSAAVQDAVWRQFMGERAVFDEYGVTPAEVERSAQRDLAAIRKDRKTGKLKAWSPL